MAIIMEYIHGLIYELFVRVKIATQKGKDNSLFSKIDVNRNVYGAVVLIAFQNIDVYNHVHTKIQKTTRRGNWRLEGSLPV